MANMKNMVEGRLERDLNRLTYGPEISKEDEDILMHQIMKDSQELIARDRMDDMKTSFNTGMIYGLLIGALFTTGIFLVNNFILNGSF